VAEPSSFPTEETYRVIAVVSLPADTDQVGIRLLQLARQFPKAVVVWDGPMTRSDGLVIAVPREPHDG
jgi:hypothetical protein